MAHFAEVDGNSIVLRVIVADQDFIDSGFVGDPKLWIETSYNTRGGVHSGGKTPLRKNYAGIGFLYDQKRDAFIPPQPYPSWILDENKCLWKPPFPYPNDRKQYFWDESKLNWELFDAS